MGVTAINKLEIDLDSNLRYRYSSLAAINTDMSECLKPHLC